MLYLNDNGEETLVDNSIDQAENTQIKARGVSSRNCQTEHFPLTFEPFPYFILLSVVQKGKAILANSDFMTWTQLCDCDNFEVERPEQTE